jgi:hypothetical protein
LFYVVLLGIRAFRYMRFSVEALLGIGAFGYTRLWVRKPKFIYSLGHNFVYGNYLFHNLFCFTDLDSRYTQIQFVASQGRTFFAHWRLRTASQRE